MMYIMEENTNEEVVAPVEAPVEEVAVEAPAEEAAPVEEVAPEAPAEEVAPEAPVGAAPAEGEVALGGNGYPAVPSDGQPA